MKINTRQSLNILKHCTQWRNKGGATGARSLASKRTLTGRQKVLDDAQILTKRVLFGRLQSFASVI